MALTAAFLAHKSALARMPHPSVNRRVAPLLIDGLIATCAIVDLEVGFSARSAEDHAAIRAERAALPRAPIDDSVRARAFEVQFLLAQRGQHRIPIPDLIIAAAAEAADLTVLHYDSDFDTIGMVTGQPLDWVVPRGSVP